MDINDDLISQTGKDWSDLLSGWREALPDTRSDFRSIVMLVVIPTVPAAVLTPAIPHPPATRHAPAVLAMLPAMRHPAVAGTGC